MEHTGRTLLLVDDDPLVLAAMNRALSPLFSVLIAASAREALELAGGHRFHALVTDFSMPREDGVWLIRTLRASGFTAPAVMVTGSASSPRIAAALAEGLITRVLTKPFDFGMLFSVLREMVTPVPAPPPFASG